MQLTYEFLKKNVVVVEILEDINVGEVGAYYDENEQPKNPSFGINDKDEIIISKGTICQFCVQPFNGHYELELSYNDKFDVCFDDEDILNEMVKFISVEKPNKYFTKEA